MVFWAKAVMLDVPATALLVLAVYFFYGYLEWERKRHAYYGAFVLCLALYTKQPCGFIVPALLCYASARGRGRKLVQREALIAYAIVLVLAFPLVIHTLKFNTLSVGHISGTNQSLWTLKRWLIYPSLLPRMFEWILLIAAGVEAVSMWRKHGSHLFWLLWVLW